MCNNGRQLVRRGRKKSLSKNPRKKWHSRWHKMNESPRCNGHGCSEVQNTFASPQSTTLHQTQSHRRRARSSTGRSRVTLLWCLFQRRHRVQNSGERVEQRADAHVESSVSNLGVLLDNVAVYFHCFGLLGLKTTDRKSVV